MNHLFTRSKLARLVPLTHISKCSLRITPSPETERTEWEHRRVELPKELSKNVIVLSCESTAKGGVCDVYVVGTVHISKVSSQQVEAIVKFLKPETVFLELCRGRQQMLLVDNKIKLKVPTAKEMFETWKKKKHNFFRILYSWYMAEVANELGVYPGAEFCSGYREAIKYGGHVVLGDRPAQITLKRTWRKLPLWHIARLFIPPFPKKTPASLSFSDDIKNMLKELEDADGSDLVSILNDQFPTVVETMVHERDKYMSYKLLEVASGRRSVVAVVGKGHLQGIKKYWKQPIQIQDLLIVPPPKAVIPTTMKIFVSLSMVVAGVAIISNTYL